ncbi:IS21 family transposase [Methylobacterium platani]|uniref:Transposase n=2 Tax=Methylobacterium platani TaxID=427683 RepID=A0A179RTU7_9HYPH|nr:transposase [Methylobacterium platani JCM 14648]OAS11912.1 transposase [Methylobacterium platani]
MLKNEAQALERTDDPRRAEMKTPDDVTAMRRLKALGWGAKRIAAELGCSKTTVKDWQQRGEWRPCAKPSRSRQLDGLTDWLAARFRQHAGNADVVRQDLATEKGIHVSLRTVERAVAPLRQDLVAAARATVRFETPPGEQMQIDFGERRVTIGAEPTRVFLFVATLGYSRRLHVRAFGHERQEDWFAGLESAFRAFGGVPREVLLDNARALVLHHDPVSREVVFHPRLQAFAKHGGFRVRACAPYRARTKGKDERGVGYVKRNAVAGRSFASFAGLEAHLDAWTREVADQRTHGTTGEAPADRFARDEAGALTPLGGVPPFTTARDLVRRVGANCAVAVDGNAYSVPWRLIGEAVRVTVSGARVRVHHGGQEVASHAELTGPHGRAVDDAHLAGLVGSRDRPAYRGDPVPLVEASPPTLLRPLSEYEAVAGGGF